MCRQIGKDFLCSLYCRQTKGDGWMDLEAMPSEQELFTFPQPELQLEVAMDPYV